MRNPIIQYVVALQFNAIKKWVIAFTLLLGLNILLMMLLISLKDMNIYAVGSFLLIDALLMVWELVQVLHPPKNTSRTIGAI